MAELTASRRLVHGKGNTCCCIEYVMEAVKVPLQILVNTWSSVTGAIGVVM